MALSQSHPSRLKKGKVAHDNPQHKQKAHKCGHHPKRRRPASEPASRGKPAVGAHRKKRRASISDRIVGKIAERRRSLRKPKNHVEMTKPERMRLNKQSSYVKVKEYLNPTYKENPEEYVKSDEAKAVVDLLCLTHHQLQVLLHEFEQIDVDGSGQIDYNEVRKTTSPPRPVPF